MSIAFLLLVLLLFVPLLATQIAGDPSTILPLVLSYSNSSRPHGDGGFRWGRHLQKAGGRTVAEARMGLYDDLLTNGYYTTRLYIGTPPQEFALIVDTGSTVTYVPCSSCEQCGNHQDPRFQPDLSSTYNPVKCSASVDCNCDAENDQCVYERQYAEMSSSSGVLAEDIVSFGNGSALKPQAVVFGCETLETGDLFSQHADGIMGLGRGHLSIMDQLVGKGVISDSFSLCYGGMDVGGGAMVLGGLPFPPDMVFTRSDPVRSPYYNIELTGIHVAGKALQLDPKIFDSKHGTVLDSGTTYAYLPEPAFTAFKKAVTGQLPHLQQIRGPDPTYKDICFSGAGSDISQLSESFPEVDFFFSNGQKLSLSPENYLFRHSKIPGAYCLGVFQNGRDPTTLLGGIIVRNTLVTYDRENEKIGFWKTNCSVLWDRLQSVRAPSPAISVPSPAISVPSPAISVSPTTSVLPSPSMPPKSPYSDEKNSTMLPFLAPSQAPRTYEQQYQWLPGQFEVGFVTFGLSLSLNYLDLAPHLPELRNLIARDLEVNVSQVQVISSQSEGNASLVRCAVFPSVVGEFMSNETAMNIISRLAEHHVRLPENFGTYQLIEWKVEPLTKRSWLQKNVLPMTLAAILVLLCSSFLTFWYFRKYRRGTSLYRPVDAPFPEHELQPL